MLPVRRVTFEPTLLASISFFHCCKYFLRSLFSSFFRPECRIFTRVFTKPCNFPVVFRVRRKWWHSRWPRLSPAPPPPSCCYLLQTISLNDSVFSRTMFRWRLCSFARYAAMRMLRNIFSTCFESSVLFSAAEIQPPIWPEHLFNLPINFTWHNQ